MFFYLLIYFILFILFLAALGLHCCAWAFLWLQRAGATLHCSARASHCSGFPCGAWALAMWASVVVAHGLSSCGSWALECRLSSCGSWASLLRGMWDLPGPGLEPVFPALAGRFLNTVPPGKPSSNVLSLANGSLFIQLLKHETSESSPNFFLPQMTSNL